MKFAALSVALIFGLVVYVLSIGEQNQCEADAVSQAAERGEQISRDELRRVCRFELP